MNNHRVWLSLVILMAIGLTFRTTPMLQTQTAPFALNKDGLEALTKQLFTKTEYYIPTKLKDLSISKVSNHKMLINTAIQKAFAETDVSTALENPTLEQISALKEQLKRILTHLMLELYTYPHELEWCGCPNAPESMRIALVVDIINDAHKERDLNKRLVYTSIASGEMLLDYLIVSELIHAGFKDIQVNFIELGLLDIPDIEAFIKQAEAGQEKATHIVNKQYGIPGVKAEPLPTEEYNAQWNAANQQETHAQNLLDNALNARSYLLAFQRKIKEKANTKGTAVEANHYDHVGDYIARAKKYDFEKTDILILVDPSTGIYPLKNSIGAQAFALQYASEDESSTDDEFFNESQDSFIVFMPRTGLNDIKLYSNIDFDSLSYDDPLRDLYKDLSSLIYEAQDVAAIRKNLNQPFDYISFMIHKVNQKFASRNEIQQQQENLNPHMDEYDTLKVYWISDPYLVLQDLVRDCLSNVDTAGVYEIAYPTKLNNDTPQLRRLDAREYQTKDVITPYMGTALAESDYKLIPPAPEARTEKAIKPSAEIEETRAKRREIKARKDELSQLPMANEAPAKSKKRKKPKREKQEEIIPIETTLSEPTHEPTPLSQSAPAPTPEDDQPSQEQI